MNVFKTILAVGCCIISACAKELNPIDPSSDFNSGLLAYYTFDDGTANDQSGQNAHATTPNGCSFVNDNGRNCLKLGYTNAEYLNIPYNFFSRINHWSVSFWIKDLTTGNVFAAQNSSSSFYNDVPKLWAKSDGMLRIETSEYTDGIVDLAYNYSQNSGTWHHFVIVADGMFNNYQGTIKFFVDGMLYDNVTPRYVQSTINGNSRIQFGGDKNGTYDIAPSMKIDNIRFYSRALTAKDISTLYNAEK